MKNVVICGGGIIGCSIAYYLSKADHDFTKIILVERNEIAGHASGKAGGFLASDWNDGNGAVGPLSRKSFQLHEDLSKELDQEIDYRKLNAKSVSAKSVKKRTANNSKQNECPDWLDGKSSTILGAQNIGDEKTTAQVHPYKLTKALFESARSRGVQLVTGKVDGIEFEEQNKKTVVKGVTVNNDFIEAEIVVIAMGPWSSQLKSFFSKFPSFPNISGGKAHSIIIEANISPDALFLSYVNETGKEEDPEFYPRPDGTVYMCGQGEGLRGGERLPDDPKDITPNEEASKKLRKTASELSSTLENATVLKEQACYLPWSPDHKPVISRVPNYEGAFIATGHGCWGILNGPATGLAMAHLILDKPCDIDLSEFSMTRFK